MEFLGSTKLDKAKAYDGVVVDAELSKETGLPAKRDPMDPEYVVGLLGTDRVIRVMAVSDKNLQQAQEAVKEALAHMNAQALALAINNDDALKLSVEMDNQLSAMVAAVNKWHRPLKDELLKIAGPLDKFRKYVEDRFAELSAMIQRKQIPYMRKKKEDEERKAKEAAEEAARVQAELDAKAEAERLAAAEAARKAAEAAGLSEEQIEQEAQTAAAMVETPPVIVPPTLPSTTKIRTEAGTSELKAPWVGELVDIRLIPDACIKARWEDLKKAVQPWINAQVKAGTRKVEGFKIERQAKIDTRRARGGMRF